MSKELIFSKAKQLAIPVHDLQIWERSLLVKVLQALSVECLHIERAKQLYDCLHTILNASYQWDLHTMRAEVLEAINFEQININLKSISANFIADCKKLAEKFNRYGIPVIVKENKLSVVSIHYFSCTIGMRINVSDRLGPYGHWFYGDMRDEPAGASRCYQVDSTGINFFAIPDELRFYTEFLPVKSQAQDIINVIAGSYLQNTEQDFYNNKLVIYQVSTYFHAVGVAFFKPANKDYGYILYCNRANFHGNTHMCYVVSAERLMQAYQIFMRAQHQVYWDESGNWFHHGVNNVQALEVIRIPSKPQKNSNCIYANPKGLIQSCAYVLLRERSTAHDEALNKAHEIYKGYSRFVRLNCVYSMIHRLSNTTDNMEKGLLKKMAGKIIEYYQNKYKTNTMPKTEAVNVQALKKLNQL